jgi:hypothetical protein
VLGMASCSRSPRELVVQTISITSSRSPGSTGVDIVRDSPATPTKQQSTYNKSRTQLCWQKFDNNVITRGLRQYFKSRLYFGLGIFLTILALICSVIGKILNENQYYSGSNVLVVLFSIIVIYEVTEATIRIILVRSYGAIFDGILLYIDLGVNLYVLVVYIESDFTMLSKALGVVNTTRLLVFIADTGLLRAMFSNLSRGVGTIFLIFIYFATWIYLFAIITYFIFNPYFFQVLPTSLK